MAPMSSLTYPTAPTSDQVDDFHGERIADPYRPLEDADAPATRAWIEAQNALTARVLEGAGARPAIRRRLAELWDHPRTGAPWRRGERWFQLRNTGLQDQDVLWVADAPEAEGTVLLDPNTLSDTGTTALTAIEVSDSGELVAYAVSDAGSDWRTWRVRRTATGDDLGDAIPWSKFSSAAWTADDAGFFYCRYPQPAAEDAYDAPNRDMELCHHRLGTDAADDPVVFSAPHEPEWGFEPEVTDDGRLLVVSIWRGTDPTNRISVADLRADGRERHTPAADRDRRRSVRADRRGRRRRSTCPPITTRRTGGSSRSTSPIRPAVARSSPKGPTRSSRCAWWAGGWRW